MSGYDIVTLDPHGAFLFQILYFTVLSANLLHSLAAPRGT